jgi:hypothetical protein
VLGSSSVAQATVPDVLKPLFETLAEFNTRKVELERSPGGRQAGPRCRADRATSPDPFGGASASSEDTAKREGARLYRKGTFFSGTLRD